MKKHITEIKVVVTIVILTVFIVAVSIFTQLKLHSDSVRLEKFVEEIEQSTQSGDWGQAEIRLENASAAWSDVKGIWAALIDHQEIDNIDVTLSRLQMLVKAKDNASSLSEAAALRKYVGHIPDKVSLSLKNIL